MVKQIIFIFILKIFFSQCSFPNHYWNQTGLIFDNDFITINRKNLSEKIFEYDEDNICVLSKNNKFIYVSIKSIKQYFSTSPQIAIPSYLDVHACFSFKGRSYIWAKDPNSISQSQLFTLPNKKQFLSFSFDLLRFDILSKNFLVYINGDVLIYNFLNFLNNPNSKYQNILLTNLTCTDIRYIGEKIYCLHNKIIYKSDSIKFNHYSQYFTNHFQFLLYPVEQYNTSNISYFNFNSDLILFLIDVCVIIMIVFIFRNRLIFKSRFGNLRYSPPPIIKELSEMKNEKIELMIT